MEQFRQPGRFGSPAGRKFRQADRLVSSRSRKVGSIDRFFVSAGRIGRLTVPQSRRARRKCRLIAPRSRLTRRLTRLTPRKLLSAARQKRQTTRQMRKTVRQMRSRTSIIESPGRECHERRCICHERRCKCLERRWIIEGTGCVCLRRVSLSRVPVRECATLGFRSPTRGRDSLKIRYVCPVVRRESHFHGNGRHCRDFVSDVQPGVMAERGRQSLAPRGLCVLQRSIRASQACESSVRLDESMFAMDSCSVPLAHWIIPSSRRALATEGCVVPGNQ